MFKKFFTLFFILSVCLGVFAGCGQSLNDVSKDINTYTINAHFDDITKTLTATETVDYINSSDVVLKEVNFHLYPNAFSENAINKPVSVLNQRAAYYNGLNFGQITICEVFVSKSQNNFSVGGEDSNILIVPLKKKLYPDDRIKIKIKFEVILPNVNHRFGYGENTYNFGNSYPIACVYEKGGFMTSPYNSNGDPFYSDMANYNVTLSFDSSFKLASSGEQTKKQSSNGKTTTVIKAKAIRDFAFVLSKKFEVLTKKIDKTTVSYFYYSDEQANKSLQAACDSLKTFSNLFCEYPYSTLSVVQTNFVHGGMEYANLVYISDELKIYNDYINTIVHEVAHQWWYGLIGNNAYDHAWLDEGLTEFSTVLFYENNPKYDIDTRDKINATLSSYLFFLDIFNSVYEKADTSMNRSLNAFNGEAEYVYMTYVKGMLLFSDLRDYVGNAKFLRAIKAYAKEYKYKTATPEDFIFIFEKTCRKNLEKYVMAWLEGKVVLQKMD